jgi:hypothetical protein
MQKLKMSSWNILENSRIWRIRMTLLVQAPDEEEYEKYFILPQSPNCNEDGKLKSNRED